MTDETETVVIEMVVAMEDTETENEDVAGHRTIDQEETTTTRTRPAEITEHASEKSVTAITEEIIETGTMTAILDVERTTEMIDVAAAAATAISLMIDEAVVVLDAIGKMNVVHARTEMSSQHKHEARKPVLLHQNHASLLQT